MAIQDDIGAVKSIIYHRIDRITSRLTVLIHMRSHTPGVGPWPLPRQPCPDTGVRAILDLSV